MTSIYYKFYLILYLYNLLSCLYPFISAVLPLALLLVLYFIFTLSGGLCSLFSFLNIHTLV